MATNVTEKDKTLNEIIDWAKSRCHEAGLSRFDVRRKSDRDFYDGQVNAFHENARALPFHARLHRLHAVRSAKSKRGREISKRYKVCPLFWSDYGCKRTLMNMGAFEELLNEGWQILRVDTMPPTELRDNAVAATNVYILEREANDD